MSDFIDLYYNGVSEIEADGLLTGSGNPLALVLATLLSGFLHCGLWKALSEIASYWINGRASQAH